MRALIQNLPADSALSRAVQPDYAGWTNTEELLATLIEVVDLSNRLYIQAHSEEHAKPPEALKIPRPYRKPEVKPKTSSPEEIKAFFDIQVAT